MASDEASGLLKKLIPLTVVVLLVVMAIALEHYYHPMPAKDCSKPYDYPICSRATIPGATAPPTTTMLFIGISIFILLASVLVYAGYHATVTEQATIITPTATIGKSPVSPPQAMPQKGVDPSLVK